MPFEFLSRGMRTKERKLTGETLRMAPFPQILVSACEIDCHFGVRWQAKREHRFGSFGVPPLGGLMIRKLVPPKGGTPNQSAVALRLSAHFNSLRRAYRCFDPFRCLDKALAPQFE